MKLKRTKKDRNETNFLQRVTGRFYRALVEANFEKGKIDTFYK